MLTDLKASAGSRVVMPDYARPDALAVPLFHFDTRQTLEALARTAARHMGVILVGPDGPDMQSFAQSTGTPDHFGFLTAEIDSPWLRDHAPVAVIADGAALQVLPNHQTQKRRRDQALFSDILAIPSETAPVRLAAGNLVRGPGGLVVSTFRVLTDNGLRDANDLRGVARQMGIARWLLVPAFEDDLSAHTDCMIRFLAPDLCAVIRRTDLPETHAATEALIAALRSHAPRMRIVEVPARKFADHFDSPVNWVQIGRTILLPEFGPDDPNHGPTAALLAAEGFAVEPVPCGTSGLGGGLHCLTASIYAAPEAGAADYSAAS